jgi:hypothetical protein
MTLREHFDTIERKLDLLLTLMGERGSRDSLSWAAGADPLTEMEQLLAEIEKRSSTMRASAGPAAKVQASSGASSFIRLLVEEDGRKIWRTFRGQCLVGRVGPDGELSVMGRWAKAAGGAGRDPAFDYYVIQASSQKFVIYRRPTDSSVGTIQICDDLAALEVALPADLFAEARSRISPAQRRCPGYPERLLDV